MPVENKMREGGSRIGQVTVSDHNAQIVKPHIGQKRPGPGTSTMLSHWLGITSEECGLSSKAEPDPEGYSWKLSVTCVQEQYVLS